MLEQLVPLDRKDPLAPLAFKERLEKQDLLVLKAQQV
jgi:hypothetical protein